MAERPQHILMPVRTSVIVASFIGALILDFLPWPDVMLAPDFVALTLAFWCVRQPRRVGLATGFVLGLLVDAGNGVLLGQHALAYSTLFVAAFGFAAWQGGISRIGANRVLVYQYLIVLTGVASGVVFFGENLGANKLLGGAIILVGVYLARRQ